jgi:two-component system, chemotaxis family, chemotaxis protein CheY
MDRRTARILIVDDSGSARRSIREALEALGFSNLDEAEDGVQALQRLVANPYDVVLSDWYMPRMTGLELLRQVRATPTLRHTPVLLVMGDVTRSHIREGCEAGANGIVTKPFIADTLAEKLNQLLGPPAGGAGAAAPRSSAPRAVKAHLDRPRSAATAGGHHERRTEGLGAPASALGAAEVKRRSSGTLPLHVN